MHDGPAEAVDALALIVRTPTHRHHVAALRVAIGAHLTQTRLSVVEHQLARLQAARQYEAQLVEPGGAVDDPLHRALDDYLAAVTQRIGDRRRDANGDATETPGLPPTR